MKKAVYLLLFLMTAQMTAQNTKLFDQATQDYADQDYKAAIKKYKEILSNEQVSVPLYYNLANANYKLRQVAPSIYFYEKALQLDPNNADVRNNLAMARKLTVDAIKENPKTDLAKIVNGLISKLSYNGWAWLAVVGSVLLVIMALLYYFSGGTSAKRLFFVGSSLGFLIATIALIFAFLQYDIQQNKKFAIVFSEASSIKAEPNKRSDEVFILHEGTKVKVLDSFSGFTKIKLADGRQGWINQIDIKKL